MSSWTFTAEVNITKLEQLARRLSNIPEMMRDVAEQIKDETVNNIEMKGIVDTGALRDSIEYEMESDGFTLRDGVSYGIYNEFGTYKMAARPFMIPAAEMYGNIVTMKFMELMR